MDTKQSNTVISWKNHTSAFFAGAFLVNTIPYMVHIVTNENYFSSAFVHHTGEHVVSVLLNIFFGIVSFIIGFVLLKFSKVEISSKYLLFALFGGILSMSLLLCCTLSNMELALLLFFGLVCAGIILSLGIIE
jgi:uncharacterized membrane protein YdcZ (DUF606 family)